MMKCEELRDDEPEVRLSIRFACEFPLSLSKGTLVGSYRYSAVRQFKCRQQENVFPFPLVDPVSKIAVQRHEANRLEFIKVQQNP